MVCSASVHCPSRDSRSAGLEARGLRVHSRRIYWASFRTARMASAMRRTRRVRNFSRSLREVGIVIFGWEWWWRVDSNHGPTDYETTRGSCDVLKVLYFIRFFHQCKRPNLAAIALQLTCSDRSIITISLQCVAERHPSIDRRRPGFEQWELSSCVCIVFTKGRTFRRTLRPSGSLWSHSALENKNHRYRPSVVPAGPIAGLCRRRL